MPRSLKAILKWAQRHNDQLWEKFSWFTGQPENYLSNSFFKRNRDRTEQTGRGRKGLPELWADFGREPTELLGSQGTISVSHQVLLIIPKPRELHQREAGNIAIAHAHNWENKSAQ